MTKKTAASTPAEEALADLTDILGAAGEDTAAPKRVHVKCVSSRRPWASTGPLTDGEVYELAPADAEILIANGFVEPVK